MNGLTAESVLSLGSPLARGVEVHETLPSTQERARELARAGAPHGTLVVAGIQTSGRGRRRRKWGSPAGGLWMSLVLRPDLEANAAPRATLTASVAVTKTLRELGVNAGIKWPNDVLVEPGGRKICGILAGSSLRSPLPGQRAHVECVILGIGLNANLDLVDLDVPNRAATTLRSELGRDAEPVELLDGLLSNLDAELGRLHDFAEILGDWRSLSLMLGERVSVHRPGGNLEGVAADVNPEGALLLETASGLVELHEGGVERLRQDAVR